MKKPYNGHESKTAWNVALWLHNNESLYRLCQHHTQTAPNRSRAAARILAELPDRTPDGFKYSHRTVYLAIRVRAVQIARG